MTVHLMRRHRNDNGNPTAKFFFESGISPEKILLAGGIARIMMRP
jgi:hypothetical protein